MPPIFSRETLSLSKPSLRGIFYFLLTIPIVLFAAEIVARSPLGSILPAPSINADSFLLDAKIYDLENQLRRDGQIDCLFIGSSVANSDFDPAIIEQVYREQTGESVSCFNLGLPALTTENATALADAAITRFHPKVIFYAILPRDIQDEIANLDFLEQKDWFTFNHGAPSWNGWLVNNSYAWRYFLTWRYWLVTQNRAKMMDETRWLTPKGFQPPQGIRKPYTPNLIMTPERAHALREEPRQAQTVERFLALQDKGVDIVLIEGPAFREPDASDAEIWRAYETDFIPTLLQLLEPRNISFWRTDMISTQISRPGWYDWIHLNSRGAVTFSQWFGKTLAENKQLFK